MAWKKASLELNELHSSLAEVYPCDKRQMFGFQVYFLNDNMFTGVYEDCVTLRLSREDKAAVMEKHDEVVPFTPMGREMREYVLIPEAMLADREFTSEWFGRSYAYTSALPAKVKKK